MSSSVYVKLSIDGTEVTLQANLSSGSKASSDLIGAIMPSIISSAVDAASGSVTDAARRRATEFVVLAFSTSRVNWYTGSRHLKRAVTGEGGSFDVDGLPPGEYFVAAIDALPRGDWQSAEALDLLVQRAERVTLNEGQERTMTLPLTRR